jgi:hypothetical protein
MNSVQIPPSQFQVNEMKRVGSFGLKVALHELQHVLIFLIGLIGLVATSIPRST